MHRREIEIHVEILSQCSLACAHCSSEALHVGNVDQLSHDCTLIFIRQLASRGSLHLFLTGGEPLASPELGEMVRNLAATKGVSRVGLFTSGCLCDKEGRLKPVSIHMATQLRENGLSCCYVSLYSHNAHVHDSVSGIPYSFACSVESIANFVAAGIQVGAHCPIMKVNHQSLASTASYCSEIGVEEIRFLRLVRHGRAIQNWSEIGLSREQQRTAIVKAVKDISRVGGIRATVAGFPELFDCRAFGSRTGCQAGITLFYIDSCGNVFPCACKKRDNKAVLGNVSESHLGDKIPLPLGPCRTMCLQDAIG